MRNVKNDENTNLYLFLFTGLTLPMNEYNVLHSFVLLIDWTRIIDLESFSRRIAKNTSFYFLLMNTNKRKQFRRIHSFFLLVFNLSYLASSFDRRCKEGFPPDYSISSSRNKNNFKPLNINLSLGLNEIIKIPSKYEDALCSRGRKKKWRCICLVLSMERSCRKSISILKYTLNALGGKESQARVACFSSVVNFSEGNLRVFLTFAVDCWWTQTFVFAIFVSIRIDLIKKNDLM